MSSAPLTEELLENASKGHALALDELYSICRVGVRHPSTFTKILDKVIIPNLDPSRVPTAKVTYHNGKHCGWMRALLVSFRILISGISSTLRSSRDDTSSSAVSALVRRILKRHFATHIAPSLRQIADYVLDDAQPAIDSLNTPETAFETICHALEVLMWPTLSLKSSFEAAAEFTVHTPRLMFRYIDRYLHLEHVPLVRLCELAQTPTSTVEFEHEPRFLPVAAYFLRHLKTSNFHNKRNQTLQIFCSFLAAILDHSQSLVLSVKYDCPEILDVSLRLWSTLLDELLREAADSPSRDTITNTLHCCQLLAIKIMTLGGCKMQRRALRKHLLQLIVRTGACDVSGPHIGRVWLKLLVFLEILGASLVHLSVLAPALHALDKIEAISLDTRLSGALKDPIQKRLGKYWVEYRRQALYRAGALQEFRQYPFPSEPALCGNPSVSNYLQIDVFANLNGGMIVSKR